MARIVVRLLLVAALGIAGAAIADFEVTGPDGRRILLKDDRTWRYVEGKEGKESKEGEKPEGHLLLRIERKTELPETCRFWLRMVNNLPYEVASLIPRVAAYKANDVLYQTVSTAFSRVRPTDSQERSILFQLPCAEIVRVHVAEADNCEMGDLNRFSGVKGQCIARVRIGESPVVRFTK